PSVFTFSIHGAKNFPSRKEPSDLDIDLPDHIGDEDYLRYLESGVWEALHRARADLAIYLAGADPHKGDRLGRMKLTKAGLARRDDIVLRMCREHHLAVAVTMAGGYGQDIRDTVEVHFQTVTLAAGWAH